MTTSTAELDQTLEYWTKQEVARFLRVTEKTVTNWVRSGRIPAAAVRKLGQEWRFKVAMIKAMLT